MISTSNSREPFVFICYSRTDDARMRELVRLLECQGISTWFDDAIRPGSNWRDELSEAIQDASLLVFLLSESSVKSSICLQEIDFALDCDTPILVVEIGPFAIPPKLSFRLGNRQRLRMHADRADDSAHLVIESINSYLGAASAGDSSTARADQNHRVGEIAVTIGPAAGASASNDEQLLSAIRRYISWTGGAFRAIRHQSGVSAHDGYSVEVESRFGDNVEVNWQLIDAPSQQILWSHHHSEDQSSFSSKRARVAEMIAEGVIEEIRRHRKIQSTDPSRLSYWDLILNADRFQGLKSETIERQRSMLDLAIARFPDLAPAHAAKANFLAWELANGLGQDRSAISAEARSEAHLAVDLDENNPYVLVSCGSALGRLGDYERGTSLCRRAFLLAPTVASKEALARSLCFAGLPDEAIDLFEEIVETMPAGRVFQYGKLVVALTQADRIPEALRYSEDCVIHFPTGYLGWLLHANLLSMSGDPTAKEAFEKAKEFMPGVAPPAVLLGIERSYGRTENQRRLLTSGIKKLLDDAP